MIYNPKLFGHIVYVRHFVVTETWDHLRFHGITNSISNKANLYTAKAPRDMCMPYVCMCIPYVSAMWRYVYTYVLEYVHVYVCKHEAIIRTGITCKKIPCYMRDPACRWFIVKKAKIF